MTHQYTNELINETSPYLLQHAHNPIHWKAWNDNTLAEAKEKNRLIIISVGYAACHWCHVMEHESFENIEVAQVMNNNYINIKVDREERPDIDQVYMNAVQLLTGSGGWPLNVVALPDGRPVWGGTYFKKEQWIKTLEQIADLYITNPEKLHEYAEKLETGIKSLDIVSLNTNDINFKKSIIDNAINSWSQNFDYEKGGTNRAPKFMMPNNLHFLLREAYQNNHVELQKYVNITLTKIAYGGIFDHIGGGFSRYSVDNKWHVPHFEKMLYDNAQLVSLYSDAYLATKNPLYKEVVYDTLDFVGRELTNNDGTFYSSLDADSINKKGDLEEGAFYVWSKKELQNLLDEDFQLFSDYYSINDYGFWEHGNYVLIRKQSEGVITKKHNISTKVLKEKLKNWKSILLKEREKRNRPRLDDKILTSWNALMTKGYIDAYRIFNEERFLKAALKNAQFIISIQSKNDGGLNHNYKNGKSTINGYLEDYATTIDAFISIYENTLDEKWLRYARNLLNYTLDYFFDDKSNMFFFTSNLDTALVSRTIEYRDNVIPASNSIMAKNLFKLSHYFGNSSYEKIATTMLNNMLPELEKYPSAFSNWMDLMLNYTNNYYEVAIVGKHAEKKLIALNKTYIPNKLIAGSNEENDLPLLKGRYSEDKTLIYVCVNKACQFPVSEINKAFDLMK
ncbi:thioredoxin domain-containing protein [Pontimicrobium aquaticum]|uniref:Thioredoxin domain-containing protein n=1 Tax=Pontimicrobium aquaticum TaxID=2565367 RepID=A0A4U0ELU3_9FLAO|nr:thioredoxin domain-containing protein [Pontimicrobium aquaticum]TJY32513.1 thioredoxin domain-containing protein [Pontimicrobium aquaticum]